MKSSLSFFISMQRPPRCPRLAAKAPRAFTILEMLVALVVLSVIVLISTQMIAGTSKLWINSNSMMSEGRSARVAFNSLTSRLSQATVAPYYGYTWTSSGTTNTPNAYVRHSELRFLSGPSTNINTSAPSSPTDAVFFVAPLGIISDTTDYGHLPSLLNICGYYIQWTNVDVDRPSILPSTGLPYHFQLMQFVQPSEQMSLYSQTANNYPTYNPVTTTPAWQVTAMTNSPAGVRPIANNVIALLLLPAMSTTDTSGTLSPGFIYNSETNWTSATAATTAANRTPPVMRVVMYTIDDISAKRLSTTYTNSTMPNLYVDTNGNTLFTDPAKLYPSTNSTNPDIGDLGRFEATLSAQKINFRRFEAAVQLPKQPWNTQN